LINKFIYQSLKTIYDDFSDEGHIMVLGDGIAKVHGLRNVTAGEMVLMGTKGIKGMALNLEHDSVGIVVFGNDKYLKEGDLVIRSHSLMSIGLSMTLFGRTIDCLGNDLFDKTSSYLEKVKKYVPIDTKAIGIIERKSVTEPMQTGIKLIDSLLPIGCGQRELIIGDRQTGKTTIAMDTIINQKFNGYAYCIYVAIGQKRSNMAHLVEKLKKLEVLKNSIVVFSASDDSASLQYLSPYAGCAIGE